MTAVSDDSVSPQQQALENCDSEPIHIPGTVQRFGCLFAGDLHLDRIDYCSANVLELLGRPAADLIGSSPCGLLGQELVHEVRNQLSLSTSRRQRARVGALNVSGRELEVFAHVNPDRLAVIELEPIGEGDDLSLQSLRDLLADCAEPDDLVEALDVVVRGLQRISGFDRVKAYVYQPNGDGEVVAEARRDEAVPSFLGLRYPAWDIPKQAREMQVRNPVRVLSDLSQDPVPVLARADSPDLDLTLAHLRGVSPVHVRYMRNMGVEGSMSLSLVVGGRLWGLLACHHYEPYVVPPLTRINCEIFSQMASLILEQKVSLVQAARSARAERARGEIALLMQRRKDVLEDPRPLAAAMRQVVDCDGLAVVSDRRLIHSEGSVPDDSVCVRLATVEKDLGTSLLAIDALASRLGDLAQQKLGSCAGCLAVSAGLSSDPEALELLFFRDEVEKTLNWAGRPEKDVDESGGLARLNPRKSFESYLEQVRGQCEPWTREDVAAVSELTFALAGVAERASAREQSTRDLLRHHRRQDLLIAELNHRVRNILALVRSVASRARQPDTTLEEYAEALEDRIAAISMAHELAVQRRGAGVDLREILETVLSAATLADSSQVFLDGPEVRLLPDAAPMFTLVMHELAANALKHGALSTESGMLRVRWQKSGDGAHLEWQEFGGPPVEAGHRVGFGGRLIREAIPYQLQGEVKYELKPSGVHFETSLGPEVLDAQEDDEREALETRAPSRPPTQLRVEGLQTVLVVEDNLILAMEMAHMLARLGAEDVETAGGVKDALAILQSTELDAVILDLWLGAETSLAVAVELERERIPYLFVSGYGSETELPEAMERRRVLTKPATLEQLAAALLELKKEGTR